MIGIFVSIGLVIALLIVVFNRWKRSLVFLPALSVGFVVLALMVYFALNAIYYPNILVAILINGLLLLLLGAFFMLSHPKRIRSEYKVKIAKLLSLYKYDYRENWLGFNTALDDANLQGRFYHASIKAMANIINSSSGKLWCIRGERFAFTDHWQSPLSDESEFQLPTSLIDFLDQTNWVVDIHEYQKQPDIYHSLTLDLQQKIFSKLDIFVPLRRGEQLEGIVGLRKDSTEQILNWEDHDLLKAAGQQMATYIGLYEATSQIYEQQQLEAFNRLSTFVVHDLKNVAAQLELITHNSEKFKGNPEFVEDAFETVANANKKITKMLNQLRRKQAPKNKFESSFINDTIQLVLVNLPQLELKELTENVQVIGSSQQLANIIQHLDQNARDAKGIGQIKEQDPVKVQHKIELKQNEVLWHIVDDGPGMSEEFMRQQLFKPFVTTKGNSGMGIGVYQCRYLLRSFGGDLIINSEVGKGTQCVVILQINSGEKHNAER